MKEKSDPTEGRRVVSIVGGGDFGTGLARAGARAGSSVYLWSRRRRRPATDGIEVTQDLAKIASSELIVLAVPSVHAVALLEELAAHLDGRHLIVHVSRGLLVGPGARLQTLSEAISRVTPARRVAAMAGPLVPADLAAGHPGGGVVGTHFPEIVDRLRESLGGDNPLRLYGSDDLLGVELACALSGALLFTLGYARARGMRPSLLGMLATRGLAEISRIGVSMGARAETFAGLAGYGDLMAAVAGAPRPEVQLGEAVATGVEVGAGLSELGANIESAGFARRVVEYAAHQGIDAPIAGAVADMLAGKLSGRAALDGLMSRSVGDE